MQIITDAKQFSSAAQLRAHYAGVRERCGTVAPKTLPRVSPRLAAPLPEARIPGALRLTPAIIECLPWLCSSAAAVEDWLQAFATASGIPAETWRTATGPVQQDIRALAAAGAVRIDRAIPARVMADLGLPQGIFDKAFHQFPLYAAEIGAPMIAASRADLAAHIHQKVGERGLSMADIMRGVCTALDVRERDIKSARRHRCVVQPRQIFFAAAKALTLRSLPEIARHCGGRDHTTALHGVAVIAQRLEAGDNALVEALWLVERELGLSPRAITDPVRGMASKWAARSLGVRP